MGYSNVAGDLNVAATTTLSTLVVNGSTQHYGPITSTSTASFSNLVANTLTVTGNFIVTATNTAVSNSISIVNQGSATALYINQNESVAHIHNVAEFYDHTQLAMVIDPHGNVAIHQTSSPGYALSVVDGVSMDVLTLGTPLAISSGGTGTATGATQNYVFAGPSSGSAGAPLFRALVNADLPSYVVVSNIYSNGAAMYSLNSSNLVGNVANANVALVVSQASQLNITSVGTLTGLNVQGLLIASNGSGISNLNSSNLVGNVANANVALVVSQASQPNITSVGTLTGLNVQGLLIVSNGSGISNLNSSNLFGNVANANVALVVSQASQPNITSVGTLTGLTVSGLLIASNGSGISNITGSNVSTVPTAQSVTVAAQGNITSVGTLTGLTVSGILSSGLYLGNASGLSNITGSNVSTVPTAQSVITAAQTNITSVGTLTGLTVSGLLIASNGSGISNITGSNVSTVPTAQSVTVAAQLNITSVGILSNLVVGNSLTTTNVVLSGNLYVSNALTTTNIVGNTLTLANATSTINVLGSVTATTFYGAHAGSNIGAFSNLYSANALVTTNLFANTLVLSNAFAGNIYASNALSTGNVFLSGSINVQGGANISFANIANIYTQNVTAVGTNLVLSSLVVNGNVYVSNATTGANGFYSIGTYGGVYSDGIVMDYVQGTVGSGRLSVGANDSLTFYTGGPSGTSTAYFDPNLRVGLGTTTPGSNLHVVGNVYASNAVTTGSIIATGISNITTANITTLYTPNFVAGAAGLFLNLYSTYTLTSAASWTGNVSGTVTPNLYTLFVAPYSVSTGQWNSYGASSIVNAPTANGGIRFNQPGPYMITAIISLDSGVKTIAVSSNTGNTFDLHSNVTNVWTYCYRSPLGDVNPWPVTIPINVTNTSQYYYIDIEANNQTDNIRQTAYANTSAQAYTGSYVIIRPV